MNGSQLKNQSLAVRLVKVEENAALARVARLRQQREDLRRRHVRDHVLRVVRRVAAARAHAQRARGGALPVVVAEHTGRHTARGGAGQLAGVSNRNWEGSAVLPRRGARPMDTT